MIDPMDVDDLGDLGTDDSSSHESHGKTVEADGDPIIENRVPRTSEASNERLQKVLEYWQSRTDKSSPANDAQWWKEWIDNGQMNGSDVDIMKALYALSPRGQVSYFLISKNYMAELWLRGVTKEEFLKTMGVSKE